MTPEQLAAIRERDRLSTPDDCEHCREYAAGPAEADRHALLALLEEMREALDSTRGALVTVAQWDAWASDWLAKHSIPLLPTDAEAPK